MNNNGPYVLKKNKNKPGQTHSPLPWKWCRTSDLDLDATDDLVSLKSGLCIGSSCEGDKKKKRKIHRKKENKRCIF